MTSLAKDIIREPEPLTPGPEDTQNPTQAHSASPSPRPSNRSLTDPDPSSLKIKKRIIVCCDGTWQDGLSVKERWKYTNILRLSRAINHVDYRLYVY